MARIDVADALLITRNTIAMDYYDVDFGDLSQQQKAWVTRTINGNRTKAGRKSGQKSMKKSTLSGNKYSGNGKNIARSKVVKVCESDNDGLILALESDEKRFVTALPNHKFIIYEKDPVVYESLKQMRDPNIVGLVCGDVSGAKILNLNINMRGWIFVIPMEKIKIHYMILKNL